MKHITTTKSIVFLLLLIGLYLGHDRHHTQLIINFDTHHKTKVIEIKRDDQLPHTTSVKAQNQRSPAQALPPPSFKRIDPDSIEFEYQLDENTFIVKNISAIPKDQYQASMGEIISGDLNYHFVQSENNNLAGRLSIYDSRGQKLKPISHIIKVPNTNEARRAEITSRGFQEHLYFEKLELLFIETNTHDFSVVYEGLKAEGFQPVYQVINRQLAAR